MNYSFDYDVAIIGSGPAGATLARLVDSRFSTVIIDKKQESGTGFTKPCGGLLAPDAQKALSKYEITMPKQVLVDPQIFSVKTIDLKTGLIRHYQRCYINMDRHKFDLWLSSMTAPHVQKMFAVCTCVERISGGFRLTLGDGGSITTRLVVGADGAASVVRRSLFPQVKLRSYIAIQQWFPEESSNPFYSCIFDPETSNCCSWSISKDSYFIFGGAFAPENCRTNFERQKEKLKSFGFRFSEPIKTEACTVLRPRSLFDFCCGRDGAFLIGEAAGFISPSSLEGISYAMESADILSAALLTDNPVRVYKRNTLKLRLKLGLKILKCPFMYNPLLRKLVMKSGIQAISIK